MLKTILLYGTLIGIIIVILGIILLGADAIYLGGGIGIVCGLLYVIVEFLSKSE